MSMKRNTRARRLLNLPILQWGEATFQEHISRLEASIKPLDEQIEESREN